MAERRMFAKTIIDSDAFLDMPLSARLLYYDLSMRADDDGFVNSPKKIMRMVGASQDDLGILILRKFIIPFDTGVVVIKHWRIHNYIRKDMYHETKYKDELATLSLDENNAYTQSVTALLQPCDEERNEPVTIPSTQDRLGKVSIGKDSLGESARAREHSPETKKYGEFLNVILTDEELDKLKAEYPTDWSNRINQLSAYMASTGKKYKSHYATIRSWARRDAEKPKSGYGGKAESSSPASYDLAAATERMNTTVPKYQKKGVSG